MTRTLSGVLPIVHTPFTADDAIDLVSLRREIDWAFAVGADGVGTGMVSEILRLTADERRHLTETIVEFGAGRGPVFAAVSAESSEQAVAHAVAAARAGCAAVMAAPPSATRLSSEALRDYYRALADGVSLPVIVQDASGYIGQAIPLSVSVDLLESYGEDKILFKPEGSPIGSNLSALRDATGRRAKIFDGSGGVLLVDSFRRGIVGTMPGMDLLDGIVALWRALEAGDEESIYRLSFPIAGIVTLQMQAGLDGFLAIEKYLLVERGLFDSERRRRPYSWDLDEETAREVDRLVGHLRKAMAPLSPGGERGRG